jgi:hypothetical protein
MTSATIAHSVRLVITDLSSKIGPGGSMSWVVGLPNNSYKPITNTLLSERLLLKSWAHFSIYIMTRTNYILWDEYDVLFVLDEHV